MKMPALFLSLSLLVSNALAGSPIDNLEEKLKNYDYSGRSAVNEEALQAVISSTAGEDSSKPEDIVVAFTLTNTASLPVRIWKRWNSWGAYAWSFIVTASDGTAYIVEFPADQIWTMNYPDPIDIPSGGSHTDHFRIFDSKQWVWYREDGIGKKQSIPEPWKVVMGDLQIRGYFHLEKDEKAERTAPFGNTYFNDWREVAKTMKEAWRGSIQSNSITIKVIP